MSVFEQWFLNNVMEVLVIVGGGSIAFMKLSSWTRRTGKQVEQNTEDIADHINAEYPHGSCRVERERLSGIHERLKSIDGKLQVVDDRIIEILRNGQRREQYQRGHTIGSENGGS